MSEKELIEHNRFLDIAEVIATSSKCVSVSVGAIFVREGRILSSGYNGSPAGYTNCNENFTQDKFNRPQHSKWSKSYEIHAEMNAILYAARSGNSLENATIYTTHSPCYDCIKNLLGLGIKHIYFRNAYDGIGYVLDNVKDFVKDMEADIVQIPRVNYLSTN